MVYEIFEANMDRLEKKLKRIEAKCSKYGCEFHYQKIGETYETVHDLNGELATGRFILVEAEGVAKLNDWEFVATVQHESPVNVIRSFKTEYAIPERYYTAEPVCEHCGSNRRRKDTYIVRNTVTGEFKQVGRSCLKDFTGGLDASAVAQYISFFDELISGKGIDVGDFRCCRYYPVVEVLQYAVESVNMYGYVKSHDEYGNTNSNSTKSVVCGMLSRNAEVVKRCNEDGFNFGREGNNEKANEIVKYVSGMETQFGYVSNLKALVGKEFCSWRDIGIVCSAVACYDKEVERQNKKRMQEEENATLQNAWFGCVGDRVAVDCKSCKLLTSWDSQYGTTYLYKFVSANGYVFTWKTSKGLDVENVRGLVGTVKNRSEYNGWKQTELTRCKVS